MNLHQDERPYPKEISSGGTFDPSFFICSVSHWWQ
jgi:hypothetical protein